ncbi:hypothetical protein Tco_0536241, partial [Tanacetum coccineum]
TESQAFQTPSPHSDLDSLICLQAKLSSCPSNAQSLQTFTGAHVRDFLEKKPPRFVMNLACLATVFVTCVMTAVATMEYQLGGALEWRLPADNETEVNCDQTRGWVNPSLEVSAEFRGLLEMGPTQRLAAQSAIKYADHNGMSA